jgi:hypothetical protein
MIESGWRVAGLRRTTAGEWEGERNRGAGSKPYVQIPDEILAGCSNYGTRRLL